MHGKCALRLPKKILFSKIFSEIEREWYRERCKGMNNDVKADLFVCRRNLRRVTKPVDINFFCFSKNMLSTQLSFEVLFDKGSMIKFQLSDEITVFS